MNGFVASQMYVHLSYWSIQTNFGRWHWGIQRHAEKPYLAPCACIAEGEFRSFNSHILQLLDENLKSKGADWRIERAKKK